MTQEQGGGLILEFGVADRLRKAREHIGADQKQFAALTGISRGTIGNYENPGYTTRKPYIIQQWAMAAGVSPEWLLTGEGHPTTPGPDGPRGEDVPTGDKVAALTAKKQRRAGGGSVTRRYPQAA